MLKKLREPEVEHEVESPEVLSKPLAVSDVNWPGVLYHVPKTFKFQDHTGIMEIVAGECPLPLNIGESWYAAAMGVSRI
jgi:hypothetical protein